MAARVKLAEPNLVDRVVSYFSPASGRKRLYDRTMLALAGGYTGAQRDNRALSKWKTTSADADALLQYDLETLRNHSSSLIRDNPLALGVINTNVTSVIGRGLKPKPTINRDYLGLDEEAADAWERAAMFEFSVVAKSMGCKGEPFELQQELAFRSSLEMGDSFALITNRERPSLPYQTAVQLIEAPRVTNKDGKRDTKTLVQGVEKDENGMVVAYHVRSSHPGSTNDRDRTWQVIPARLDDGRPSVLHIVRPTRIGQTRGVPYLTPVIEALKQLGRYTEGELMAAVIGGMYTVFIKTESGDAIDAMAGDIRADQNQATTDSEGELEMGNGAILGLAEDESIEVANPGRPNSAFDPFVQAILRQIGVALEIPFELLVKHFTASYTAAQAALLEAWRYFSGRRHWLVNCFCQPVYEAVIDEAVAMGRLLAPGYFADPFVREAYLSAVWIGDARGTIDIRKEAEGQKVWNEMGVKTLEEITIETTGRDWEANHTQSAKEHRRRTEDGLVQPAPAQPAQRVQVEKDEP